MSFNNARINKEIKQLKDEETMFKLTSEITDISNFQVDIIGQIDTLYYGYRYTVDIIIPSDFPKSSPEISFITPIIHPNIKNNSICLDLLKKGWNSKMTISSVLKSIVMLLGNPEFSDPWNLDLTKIYKENNKEYEIIIKNHCSKNAIKN